MKILTYISCLLILTTLGSCLKNIPLPDETSNPITVVNSTFTIDSTLSVHISESCHLNVEHCNETFISNASVIVNDDAGVFLSNLTHQSNGVYSSSDIDLSAGSKYQIEVSHPGQGNTVTKASNKIPKSFNAIVKIAEERLVGLTQTRSFNVEIEDDPDEENFYLLFGTFEIDEGEHEHSTEIINGYEFPHVHHYTLDINAENEEIYSKFDVTEYALPHVYLTDKTFNGQTYTTEMAIADADVLYNEKTSSKATIFVRSVSREMYEYFKSIDIYNLTQGSIFSEPEPIYSNIENGAGIFGGYTEQSFEIDLPLSEYRYPTEILVENNNCSGPCTVTLMHDGGSKLNYSWDFGNGVTSSEQFPQVTFEEAGEYNGFMDITLSTIGSSDSWGLGFTVLIN